MGALIKERGTRHLHDRNVRQRVHLCLPRRKPQVPAKRREAGYHAPSGNTPIVLAAITAHATEFLNQANVPEDFIRHIFATPSDSVWYPTLNELREANIITDVVK